MVSVIEYGENIGTLKNLFEDYRQAVRFAKRIIAVSENQYKLIAPYLWWCREKGEYIKIESD